MQKVDLNTVCLDLKKTINNNDEFLTKFYMLISDINENNFLSNENYIELVQLLVNHEKIKELISLTKIHSLIFSKEINYEADFYYALALLELKNKNFLKANEILKIIDNILKNNKEVKSVFSFSYIKKKIEIAEYAYNDTSKLISNLKFSSFAQFYSEDILGLKEIIAIRHNILNKNEFWLNLFNVIKEIELSTGFFNKEIRFIKSEKYNKLIFQLANLIQVEDFSNKDLPSQAWMILAMLCASRQYINEYYKLRTLSRDQALNEKLLSVFHYAQYIRAKAELQQNIEISEINIFKALLDSQYKYKSTKQASKEKKYYSEMLDLINLYFGKKDDFISEFSKLNHYDKNFADFVKGKSIAIVGPINNELINGPEIDEFDLVLRFNYSGLDGYNKEIFGSKTNISSYASPVVNVSKKIENIINGLNDLDIVIIEGNFRASEFIDKINTLENKVRKPYHLRMIYGEYNIPFFRSKPNAIQNIVVDLLQYPVGKIKIFNANLYIENNYHKQYRSSTNNMVSNLIFHDLVSNFIFTKILLEKRLIEADETLTKILSMSEDEYISNIAKYYVSIS